MKNRILCQMASMILLGTGWMLLHHPGFILGAVFLCLYLFLHDRKKGRLCLLLICFVLGGIRGYSYGTKATEIERFLADSRQVSFRGELQRKQYQKEKVIYRLCDVTIKQQGQEISCSSILLYPDSDDIPIGNILIGKGTIEPFRESRNDGNFDEKIYQRSYGVFAKIVHPKIEKSIETGKRIPIELEKIQKAVSRVYAQHLPGEESGILDAMVLGDTKELQPEVKTLFQTAGLSHILVISGLHISFVGMLFYRIGRKLGWGYWISGGVAFLFVCLYGSMCGMGLSTLRAVIMFGIMLYGNARGYAYDSATAVAVVATLLAWWQPFYLQHTGYWLSFMAVLGVITVGKKIYMPIGIQLFTLPVIALLFFEVPVYAVVLNILLLPFVGLLLGLGMVGGILGVVWLPLGTPFLLLCHWMLYGYEWCMDASLKLPMARLIVGCPKWYEILLYYVLLYVVFYLVKGKKRWAILFGALLLLCGTWRHTEKIDMLDVGQGDAIFLQSKEGVAFFIDGGSTDITQVGKYRILPYLKYHGVKQVDYWFVSHTDWDHISGLVECLEEGYPIEHMVFSHYVVKNEAYQELCEKAKCNGTVIEHMREGDICGTKTMEFECIAPGKQIPAEREDANGMSLVLLLKTETMRGLFTGDIGQEQEVTLPYKKIGRVDVLKAAHHGSNGSNSEKMLTSIQPDRVVISCGKDNSYGHPGKEALERMEAVTRQIDVTMEQGQITIF